MKINISKYPHIQSPFVINIGGKLDRNHLEVDAFDLSVIEKCASDSNEEDVCEDISSSI